MIKNDRTEKIEGEKERKRKRKVIAEHYKRKAHDQ